MRITSAVLIVLVGASAGHAQSLEQPPGAAVPLRGTVQQLPQQRSGPVCMKPVPVDPSIDPRFAFPVFESRQFTMRRLQVPPCVTLTPPQSR